MPQGIDYNAWASAIEDDLQGVYGTPAAVSTPNRPLFAPTPSRSPVGSFQVGAGTPVRSAEEQAGRRDMMAGILGGGGGGNTVAGIPGTSAPTQADLQTAYNRQQQHTGTLLNMLTGGSPSRDAVDALLRQSLTSTTGLGDEVIASERRDVAERNANARANATTNLRNRLAANGGSGSLSAALAEGQIAGDYSNQLDRGFADIAARDAQARTANRNQATTLAAQLAQGDQQFKLGAAQTIGQIQEPVIPGVTGGGGVSNNSAGGRVASPGPTVNRSTGFLNGTLFGNAGSNAQYNTAQGNALYRQRTGQDLPRTWGGQAFFGFR